MIFYNITFYIIYIISIIYLTQISSIEEGSLPSRQTPSTSWHLQSNSPTPCWYVTLSTLCLCRILYKYWLSFRGHNLQNGSCTAICSCSKWLLRHSCTRYIGDIEHTACMKHRLIDQDVWSHPTHITTEKRDNHSGSPRENVSSCAVTRWSRSLSLHLLFRYT